VFDIFYGGFGTSNRHFLLYSKIPFLVGHKSLIMPDQTVWVSSGWIYYTYRLGLAAFTANFILQSYWQFQQRIIPFGIVLGILGVLCTWLYVVFNTTFKFYRIKIKQGEFFFPPYDFPLQSFGRRFLMSSMISSQG